MILNTSLLKHFIEVYISKDIKENNEFFNVNSVFYEDSKKRLGFHKTKFYVHDFKLSYTWSFKDFIKDYLGFKEQDINKLLFALLKDKDFNVYVRNNIKYTKDIEEDYTLKELKLPLGTKYFNNHTINEFYGSIAIKYLIKRFIYYKHTKKFQLMYNPEIECQHCYGTGVVSGDLCPVCNGSGKNNFFGRIIIPSYENNKLVYFQGRDFLGTSSLKYLNPSENKKSNVLYFYDLLQPKTSLYITEGIFDAITLYNYNVTAQLGSLLSKQQIKKILSLDPQEIIFIPDNDKKSVKQIVLKNLYKNIYKLIIASDNKIPIKIYWWFKDSKYKQYKDINEANLTFINNNYIVEMNTKIAYLLKKGHKIG